jgi:hypothetical protein
MPGLLVNGYVTEVTSGGLGSTAGSPLVGSAVPRSFSRACHSAWVTGVYAPYRSLCAGCPAAAGFLRIEG